jgi:Fur family transcriptional regulator, ferric uptake regulator
VSHHTRDYSIVLHQRGFRLTPQRQFILDAICDGHGHTTVDEILERVQAKAPAVNRATVYRTLDFLCEQRLVVAANIGRQTVYEIASKEPHHHLVCLKCGRQEQLAHSLVKPFFAKVGRAYGFSVETNHLALFGLCRQCQAAGQ